MLGRTTETYHGMAYSGRPPRPRSAHSSRGGHVPPRRPGKLVTGQRGTGDLILSRSEVCEMQSAETVLSILLVTGEQCARKACKHCSGRGRRKRTSAVPRRRPTPLGGGPGEKGSVSTSPAAYPTAVPTYQCSLAQRAAEHWPFGGLGEFRNQSIPILTKRT
jgi:hypothetical protein